jgi:hypothetical protein
MIDSTVRFSIQVWARGVRCQPSRWLPKRPAAGLKTDTSKLNTDLTAAKGLDQDSLFETENIRS